ncbi:GGDEF domain-containing protein [Sphingomonas pituitosa]|uniref:GGDEF domain-containing protein n=1 Tax=Sphingomonas pituitosa TaxID=99597 RepID=UPI0008364253|nr:GGDEF domain-containing protein [Sphingomonas pituitosa]
MMQLIGILLHGGTLIFINALLSLLSSFAFLLAYWIQPRLVPPRSLLCWCAAYLSFAAGFAVLMLPAFDIQVPGLGLFGNLLIDAGAALNFVAIVLYLKRPRSDLWVLIPAALLALIEAGYVLSHFENMRVMVGLGCAVRGILTMAAAMALWRCADESRRPVARLAAVIHALWALMLLSRILWWLFNPAAEVTFDPTTAFGLTTRLVLTCAITPCFLWMLARQLDAELLRYASRDALTGLANRRVVWEQGEARLAQAARQHRALAVLMIDVDHFKKVNDSWGHAAGDAVLAAVAHALAGAASDSDLVGRIGGEEFLVVPARAATAAALAEKLRAAVADLQVAIDGDTVLRCTISIGHAEATGAEADWHRLVTEADTALYAAKQGGRNRVVSRESRRGEGRGATAAIAPA